MNNPTAKEPTLSARREHDCHRLERVRSSCSVRGERSSGEALAPQRYNRMEHVPAFTLVELMVVVVILGLLATVVTVSVKDYLVTGKQSAARVEIAQLSNALDLFYTENDRYPTTEEGLALLQRKTSQHPHGILRGDLLDPWGHAYVYVCPGLQGAFDIVSYGANGVEGGEGPDADIESWDLAGHEQKQ